jgi:group II intron reverse transcriptase/maturase
VARTAKQDKVRELQRTLYRAAKADPGRRFHALYDKVYRRDVLEWAWESVRANKGAAGIDRQTIADVEEYGIAQLLDELVADLKDGSYRPLAARRVFIPKPGRSTEQRPLSIPTVRDRVVQAALKTVIEPIFEADMLECSFGFRPRRSQHDALQVLVDEAWDGRRWVAESDVSNCLGAIPHDGLMSAIEERISDRHVLNLLRAMLRSGVMQDGAVTREATGTPQGGVISPCLCNVYLHRRDRQWATRGHGVLVRFADDLLAMCRTRAEAEAALASLRLILRSWALSSRTPRPGSCIWRREARALISSASTTGGCAPTAPGMSSSSPAGAHAGRCSTPATAFVRSRRANGCCSRSKTSCRASTGICAAGRATSDTETPPVTSTRSAITRPAVWRRMWRASQALPRLRLVGLGLPVAGPSRADRSQRNRRRAASASGVARDMSRMPAVKNVGEPCAGEPVGASRGQSD